MLFNRIMDFKTILLVLAVIAVLAVVGLIVLGKTKQGFQNPSPPSVPTFTMFFAEWCGHCKKAKPGFVEFMSNGELQVGSKKVKIDMIDADSGNEKLKRMDVKGYPTFMLELPSGEVKEYKGKRDVDGYLKFLSEELGIKNDTA
jgi:thiol-disulfide isomerase/thioredoxin